MEDLFTTFYNARFNKPAVKLPKEPKKVSMEEVMAEEQKNHAKSFSHGVQSPIPNPEWLIYTGAIERVHEGQDVKVRR
jgi:hypothetical protein